MKDDEAGVLMEENKTIRSYNLKMTDSLELKEKVVEKDDQSKKKLIVLKIESVITSTTLLKISIDATIDEVIDMFVKKNPVPNPSAYGIVKHEGNKLFGGKKTNKLVVPLLGLMVQKLLLRLELKIRIPFCSSRR